MEKLSKITCWNYWRSSDWKTCHLLGCWSTFQTCLPSFKKNKKKQVSFLFPSKNKQSWFGYCHTTQANDGDSPNHCRVPAAAQPPGLQCRLGRYAGGNHISFLYKVPMFCWWCTGMELASWRDQDIQGPLEHSSCQNCCDHCITGGDNLETFPSVLKLVAVFPFGSLGIGGGVGWKYTTMCWCAALTRESVTLSVSAAITSTDKVITHLHANTQVICMCNVDAHFLVLYPYTL